MRKKHWSILGLALGVLVLGVVVGLMTVNTVAADPTPGVKIQIPRVDVGDVLGTGDWETWIQVQNVGTVDTGAIFLGWGEYSEKCPTNDPGVIAHYCALIRENALWTLKGQLTDTVKSGIIYTVRRDLYTAACSAAKQTERDTDAWRCWKKELEFGTCEGKGGGWADPPGAQGEEVAVTVTRYGPNDSGTFVSSTYTGISEEMEGEDPPYNYYAPYAMKGYLGLDTEMTIQNSGQECTSVWIDYMEQGTCYTVYKEHIVQLAPGEAVRVKVPTVPPELVCNWPGWLGSAHISAEMPLGIIVDQTSFDVPCGSVDRGTLLTYRARPKVEVRDSQVITDTLVYADLIFREWSGWDASIQVQNLSVTSQRTFVTVDFLDNSGDEILFLADWVCPTGSTTFYLPPVTDLGFNYVGAAEIQSHDQVAFPGGVTPAQPIFAVVDLKRADDPFTPQKDAQAGSYNAHPYSQKEWVSEIALPFMAKDASNMYTPWTSMIAIRNNSNCNKIKPKIWFKDETGDLLCELQIPWLQPKHVKLIDLDNLGCLYPGYVGAAKVIIEPEEVEQLCDIDNDGHVDNAPFMPSVIVVEKGVGGIAGDITNVYEGIPYAYKEKICYGDILGKVHSIDPCSQNEVDAAEPIEGVTVLTLNPVTLGFKLGLTDSTGDYEVEDVQSGLNVVRFSATDFLTYTTPLINLDCGEDEVLDAELLCLGKVGFKVVTSIATDENTSIIAGATVTYTKPYGEKAKHYGDYYRTSGTTDNTGVLTLTVPILNATGTFTVSAPGIAETGVFTWTQMVNTPTIASAVSIWGGLALNSRILTGTIPITTTTTGNWNGFDDGSCANIGSADRSLNNQGVKLMLCGLGTVAGRVTVAGNNAPGRLVEVIQDGVVVGSDTTDANGVYIISGVPTGCFSAAGCQTFVVRCMGWTQPTPPEVWEGCGDVERVDFPF